ncbi:Vps51/Vps67 family protein [Cryptosporidium felis]|nr:Vps51/Vps67 family protein [Cryptosporidium felis]
METQNQKIKDELQAYYGSDIINDQSNDYFGEAEAENDDLLLGIEFKQEFSVEETFNYVLKTKTIKEVLLINKQLEKKIEHCQSKMQSFIHSNYNKLYLVPSLFEESESENLIQNVLQENDIKGQFQHLKKNIFTSENDENLDKFLTLNKLNCAITELKRFHLILQEHFLKQNYSMVIMLFKKWKKALERLSEDFTEFNQVIEASQSIFDRTVIMLKNQLLVSINKDSIIPEIKLKIKAYLSLSSEGPEFAMELTESVNGLFTDIINEITVKQIQYLEKIPPESNKTVIFLSTCKQSYQEIFVPLKFIILELGISQLDPSIPSLVIEHLFEHSFSKIIELLEHIITYENRNLNQKDLKYIISGFEYLNQSTYELLESLNSLKLENHTKFDHEKCRYIETSSEIHSPIIKRKYMDWIKNILCEIININNLDLGIPEIWNTLFDVVISSNSSDISDLFHIFNRKVLEKVFHFKLTKIINDLKELAVIDFDICENFMRKLIKDIFQKIISDSISFVGSIFANKILDQEFDFYSIENFQTMAEKINLELSFCSSDNFLEIGDKNGISDKFSLMEFNQKVTYLLLIILMIRYLRSHTLHSGISFFYECFYNNSDSHNLENFKLEENSTSILEFYDLNSQMNEFQDRRKDTDESDATVQIISIFYSRFENLFLNIFVIWSIHSITYEIKNDIDLLNCEKIHFNELIDSANLKIHHLIKALTGIFSFQLQSINHLKKRPLISDLQFPIENFEKLPVSVKNSIDYYILGDFDLDNSEALFKPFTFWVSQIVNGSLTEITSLIKDPKNPFSSFISLSHSDIELYEKSIVKLWDTTKPFCAYDDDFNTTYALFCELYNTLQVVCTN